jgi:hypothetical protein
MEPVAGKPVNHMPHAREYAALMALGRFKMQNACNMLERVGSGLKRVARYPVQSLINIEYPDQPSIDYH